MSVFKMGTLAEEQKKQTEYVPLKENLYILEVFNAEEVQTPSYNDKSVMQDQIKVTFKALKPADGTPLKDMNGNHPDKNLLSIWLNPDAVGFNKKTNQPHKTRAVLTAIMGVPVDAKLELQSFDDLVGLKVRAYVSLAQKGDGSYYNKLDKFSAIEGQTKEKSSKTQTQISEEGEVGIKDVDTTPDDLPWEDQSN